MLSFHVILCYHRLSFYDVMHSTYAQYLWGHLIKSQTAHSETLFKDLSTHTITSSKKDFQC